MEDSLSDLRTHLAQQSLQLKEITEALQGMKAENRVLRNEILGVGVSSGSHPGTGLLEKKTLRQVVEEMCFEVKEIKLKIITDAKILEESCSKNCTESKGDSHAQEDKGMKPLLQNSTPLQAATSCFHEETKVSISKSNETLSPNLYRDIRRSSENLERQSPIKVIKHRTAEEYRGWERKRFTAAKLKQRLPTNGATLASRTFGQISDSVLLSEDVATSCAIKISNGLNSALCEPQHFIFSGKILSGPSVVPQHTVEAVVFQGSRDFCSFMVSFWVNIEVRLAIVCMTQSGNGQIRLGLAFTPAESKMSSSLYTSLIKIRSMPDVWMMSNYETQPIELFVSHKKLLVRSRMLPGLRSVVEVEILEDPCTENALHHAPPKLELGNPERDYYKDFLQSSLAPDFSCVIEIANNLNVSLKRARRFLATSNYDNLMPPEVLPFTREMFIAFNELYGKSIALYYRNYFSCNFVDAMFSYEIDSTDLGIAVALRVRSSKISFTAAFLPRPAIADERTFKALVDPKQWTTPSYRKFANENSGEQVIRIRNIQATVRLTQDRHTRLSIHVFVI